MTATPDQPLTPLDKQRLNAWFEHDSRLPDLADELNTTVLELAEWAAQPHIARRLDTIALVARQRNATLRAEAQHAATSRLLRIVRFCDHDEVARRAADRLLRALPTSERPLDGPDHDLGTPNKKPPTNPPITVPTPRPPAINTLASPSLREGLGWVPCDQKHQQTGATSPTSPLPEGGGQGVGSSTPQLQPTQLANQPHNTPSESPSLREGLGWVPCDQKHQQTGATSPTHSPLPEGVCQEPRARPPPHPVPPHPLTPPPPPSPPRPTGAVPNSTPTLVAPCPVPTITALFGAFHVRDYR